MNKTLLPVSIIVAGLIIAGAFFYTNSGGGKTLSAQEVGELAIEYINENFNIGSSLASLVSVAEEGGVYKIYLKIGETDYQSYATKDGKFLFPEGHELTLASGEEGVSGQTVDIEKRDRPDVKLFVMSYCPYGLQAQKAFYPVYDLLGSKVDMAVYFVNYIMHEKEEIDENIRQYCIQKEEKDKYSAYLSCFTKEGDYQKCRDEAGVNPAKIESCFFDTNRDYDIISLYNNKDTWLSGNYPLFPIDDELNKQYGVGGSPTLVINDVKVDFNLRSPENLKSIICQAFNSAPEECSQTLSTDVPSAGIGGGTGDSGGSCE